MYEDFSYYTLFVYSLYSTETINITKKFLWNAKYTVVNALKFESAVSIISLVDAGKNIVSKHVS